MRLMSRTGSTVDLSGIDDHTISSLPLITAAGVTKSQSGDILVMIHQAAFMPDGKTILSAGQMEWNKCTVDDKPKAITGRTPSISTPDGYQIPISVRRGLPYIRLRPPTDMEINELPRIDLTSMHTWDPKVLDATVHDGWYEEQPPNVTQKLERDRRDFPYDGLGNLKDEEPIDYDDEGLEDRYDKSIDRNGIKAFYAHTIRNEMQHSFKVCNIEGVLHDIHEDDMEDSDEACTTTMLPGIKADEERRYSYKTATITELQEVNRTRSKQPRQDGSKRVKDDEPNRLEEHVTEDPRDEGASDSDDDDGETPFFNNQARDDEERIRHEGEQLQEAEPRLLRPSKKNVAEYSKYFPGTDDATLKKTFDATTQYGTRGATEGHSLRNQILSPNPILNIPRRHEEVATDTLYSSEEAFDDGSTAAQFYIGRKSHFRTALPLGKSDKNFPATLLDTIRRYGAMDVLVSDNAKAEISERVKDILRTFAIKDRQSEPYNGNQNFAERGWRDTKRKVNILLNISGAPAKAWLLALQYVCFVQNHTAVDSLGGRTPIEWMLGHTPDISVLLQFQFWEPVYYQKYDAKFPSDSTEELGRFVGIAETTGHSMTYKILTAELKIIHRAVVRTATKEHGYSNVRADKEAPNLAPPTHPEVIIPETVDENDDDDNAEQETNDATEDFIKSVQEDVVKSLHQDRVDRGERLPTIDSTGLLGRTFLPEPDDQGEQHRAKIEGIELTGKQTADGKEEIYKFRCKVGEEVYEQVMTYNKMLEWCERDQDRDDMYKIDGVLDHKQGAKYKGGYQLLVQYASGDRLWVDLTPLYNDDPVSVSLYAMKNNLLHLPGFKRCRNHTKNYKKFARMIHQSKLKNYRCRPVYSYGYQVPRNHQEAVFIDEKCGNTKWQDAEKLEIQQLFEYDTFRDLGLRNADTRRIPEDPMSHDIRGETLRKTQGTHGRRRPQDRNPADSIYSGVVSLPGLRLVTFIAELNGLELWGTDIGNAYLESYTEEKVCFIAGGEFGELAGHTFMIIKAQYGLEVEWETMA